MAFTSDRRWLAVCPIDQPARLWPLRAADGTARDLLTNKCIFLATHPTRSEVFVGTTTGEFYLCPTEGGSPRLLPGGWPGRAMAGPVAFDSTGRWAVAAPYGAGRGFKDPEDRVLQMWDLESVKERVYSIAHLTDDTWDGAYFVGFATDGRLCGPLGKAGKSCASSVRPECVCASNPIAAKRPSCSESAPSRKGFAPPLRSYPRSGSHSTTYPAVTSLD
ncbi:MAG: hypothetical protein AB9869_23865 [Verrucomicrobiia bacterium]